MAEPGRAIERLAGEIARKERIPREHMSSLVEKLMLLESTVGEEYYILIQLKTLEYMAREIREIYNVDLEGLMDILETIIRDEETHRELAKNENPLSEKKSRQKI